MDKIVGELIGYGIILLPAVVLLCVGLARGWFSLKPALCHAPLWGHDGQAILGLLFVVIGGYLASAVAGAVYFQAGSSDKELTGTSLIAVNLTSQVGALIAELGFGLLILGRRLPLLLVGDGDARALQPLLAAPGLAAGVAFLPFPPPPSVPLPGIRPSWEVIEDVTALPLTSHPLPTSDASLPVVEDRFVPIATALPPSSLLSPRRWPWGVMLLTLPAAWSVNVLTQLALSLTGQETGQEHEMVKTLQEQPATLWLIALSATVLAPLTEEFLFRGLMQSFLRGWLGRWGAVALAATLFMLVHPMFSWPAIFTLGILLGIIYERSGTLMAPILVHVAFNGVTVLITAATTLAPTTHPTTTTALLHVWPLFH